MVVKYYMPFLFSLMQRHSSKSGKEEVLLCILQLLEQVTLTHTHTRTYEEALLCILQLLEPFTYAYTPHTQITHI